jgi:outer membrane protein TolC
MAHPVLRHLWLAAAIGVATYPAHAQTDITLQQAYEAARTNYPLLKQQGILYQSGELAVASLEKNRRLPQLSLSGQATWQSAVTSLSIELPNVAIPRISKDQYRLTLDASYTLFDGQLTYLQTQVQRAATATAQQQIEVELHRLRDQVNGLFMNALLTDESIRLTQTLLAELQRRISTVTASVTFGTVSQMHLDILRAEVLKSEQRVAELQAARRGTRETLHLLTDLPITDSTRLVANVPSTATTLPLNRPELQLYRLQRTQLDAQYRLIGNRLKPRLSLFAQPGFGRPGLNLLDNDFAGYFLGGVRLNWNLSGAYTRRNDEQAIRLNQQTVDFQQATIERNLTIQLRQQQTEIEKLEAQLASDQALIDLRVRIRKAAAAQLDNGVIAARDYTTELTNEHQARLNLALHQLQLLLARIQYQTISGN